MNNIVLCGFMGCGKSTVGGLLAKRLGRAFIDTDEYIEQMLGMSVAQIFVQHGEDGFRELENKACLSLAGKSGLIIATGGGALTYERNVAAFSSDTVIFMDVPFDEIERRIGDADTRPLFRDKNKARSLFEARLPLYKKAARHTVDASGDKHSVAERIIDIIGVI